MRWQLLFISIVLASSNLAALAQAPLEQKSQEDWLRYSNWEHRATSAKRRSSSTTAHAASADEPASSGLHARPISPSTDRNSASARPPASDSAIDGEGAPVLPLPENPGSQTVQGSQPTVPGWAFQPPAQVQRSAEIFLGNANFGSGASNLAPYGGAPYRTYSAGNINFWPKPVSLYSNSSGGRTSWLGRSSSIFAPATSGFRSNAFLPGHPFYATEVIETGPSPSSGNYFQPATIDPSASGNYYASGAPWQVPLNQPSTTKDYWGSGGNPFNK